MSNVSASAVKELREKTGVGMMECKKALTESDGDLEKAIVWLREKGFARASKKTGRVTAEGIVEFAISPDHTSATMIELNCETDFAARNSEFTDMAKTIAKAALHNNCTTVEELLKVTVDSEEVGTKLTNLIAKIGENMTLRRVSALSAPQGIVVGYSHMGGKIGTLVALSAGKGNPKAVETGKDLAMHVAATGPKYLNSEQVTKEEISLEQDIARKKLAEEGKPANMIDKIVEGHVKKFFKEICLLDQPFVKEPKQSIADWFKASGVGGEIVGFHRFQLGEGIEKKETDFAAEVAAQIK